MNKVTQAKSRLEQEYGREATTEEIAEITKMKEDDVKISVQNYIRPVSMDAPLGSEEENSNMYDITEDKDSVSPISGLLKESLKVDISRTLSTLPQSEADVLRYYYGLDNVQQPLLVEEIARRLKVSPERVRQIKSSGLKKLRNISKTKILKTYPR